MLCPILAETQRILSRVVFGRYHMQHFNPRSILLLTVAQSTNMNKYGSCTELIGDRSTKDLDKPFYLALAARLFLSNFPEYIPTAHQVEDQAEYWKFKYMHGSGDVQHFIEKVKELDQTHLVKICWEFFVVYNVQNSVRSSFQTLDDIQLV